MGRGGGYAQVVLLEESRLLECTKDLVKAGKGTLGPDDKTTEVTTRRKLEEVQAGDADDLDTGQVPEGLSDPIVLIEDDQRTTALPVTPVPHLSLARTELTRVGDLDDVGIRTEGPEESDGLLCLLVALRGVGDDEGDLFDLLDAVTTGEDKRRESRGCEGRDDSEATLVLIDLYVPAAPDLCRGEHATAAAHVTEGSLA